MKRQVKTLSYTIINNAIDFVHYFMNTFTKGASMYIYLIYKNRNTIDSFSMEMSKKLSYQELKKIF